MRPECRRGKTHRLGGVAECVSGGRSRTRMVVNLGIGKEGRYSIATCMLEGYHGLDWLLVV